jgi:hypothetical protein
MMTCDTNRRAIVGAILAAGAVGATLALPAVAAASIAPSHPDADVLGAEARLDAAIERWQELAKRIATTRAKTTEGLIAKLAFVAPAYDDNDLKGTYDGVLASAALDAQALART